MVSVGVALEGVGWHPSAWQAADTVAAKDLFGVSWWRSLGQQLDFGGVDYVTVEDGIGLQSAKFGSPDRRDDQVRGRLDSVVVGSVLAATTERLEIVVSRNVSHTLPFHIAAQLASLSDLAPGRVIWRPQVSASADDAGIVGGAPTPRLEPDDNYVPKRIARTLRPLFEDAADFVGTVRHLWASWPGDSLVGGRGEVAHRRFVDRDRIISEPVTIGRYATTGPVNVPVLRVPKIASLAHHAEEPYRFAATIADRVFVTPEAPEPLAEVLAVLRGIQASVGRPQPATIHADLVVFLGHSQQQAQERKARLDAALGYEWSSDAQVFVGTPEGLVEFLQPWVTSSEIVGVRLRPGVIPFDVDLIVSDFLPLFRARSGQAAEVRTAR